MNKMTTFAGKSAIFVTIVIFCCCAIVGEARGGRGGGGGGRGGGRGSSRGLSRGAKVVGAGVALGLAGAKIKKSHNSVGRGYHGYHGYRGDGDAELNGFNVKEAPQVQEINFQTETQGQNPEVKDPDKDIRGGGGKMQSVIVAVVVVILGIIVVVLAIYILLYFCGNCCGKDDDDVTKTDRDVEMQGREMKTIHEEPDTEKAPLMKEYTLNDQGEKVEDTPRLYPQVDTEEPVPPEARDKKPLYPELQNGPTVTEATIEKHADVPGEDRPPPLLSLDEPDIPTQPSTPPSTTASHVPTVAVLPPALVPEQPREAQPREEQPREEQPREEQPREEDRMSEPIGEASTQEEPLINLQENAPSDPPVVLVVASDPVAEELKRKTLQPVTRSPETQPELEIQPHKVPEVGGATKLTPIVSDKEEKSDSSEESDTEDKPAPSPPVIIIPESKPKEKTREPEKQEERPEDGTPAARKELLEEEGASPVPPKPEDAVPERRGDTVTSEEEEASPGLAAIAAEPDKHEEKNSEESDTVVSPAVSTEPEAATPVVSTEPEATPETSDTDTEEGKEPSLLIKPPVPTNWEEDDTPVSPNTATLPIRGSSTAPAYPPAREPSPAREPHPIRDPLPGIIAISPGRENEIPEFSPPRDTQRPPSASSSEESITLDSEGELPVGGDAPLADLQEEDSEEDLGEEEMPDTPVKVPDTTVSHPKVLHYEAPTSDSSSQSASPPLAEQPISGEETLPETETQKLVKQTLDDALRDLDQTQLEGQGSASPSESDGSPAPPGGRKDSGFMSLPRDQHAAPPTPAEHAGKMADQIIEDAKQAINKGHV